MQNNFIRKNEEVGLVFSSAAAHDAKAGTEYVVGKATSIPAKVTHKISQTSAIRFVLPFSIRDPQAP